MGKWMLIIARSLLETIGIVLVVLSLLSDIKKLNSALVVIGYFRLQVRFDACLKYKISINRLMRGYPMAHLFPDYHH